MGTTAAQQRGRDRTLLTLLPSLQFLLDSSARAMCQLLAGHPVRTTFFRGKVRLD